MMVCLLGLIALSLAVMARTPEISPLTKGFMLKPRAKVWTGSPKRVSNQLRDLSTITTECIFYDMFKDLIEYEAHYEMIKSILERFCRRYFKRCSANRACGERKMCWTLHFKKFWGENGTVASHSPVDSAIR